MATGNGDVEGAGGVSSLFFNLVSKHAQSQRLHFSHRLLLGLAVDHHSGERGNFGDPPPIIFAFQFNLKIQSPLSFRNLAQCIVEHLTCQVNTAFILHPLGFTLYPSSFTLYPFAFLLFLA